MTDGSHDTKRNMWLPATLLKHVASCHSSVPLAGQYSAFFEIVAMAGLSCKKKALMPPFAFASFGGLGGMWEPKSSRQHLKKEHDLSSKMSMRQSWTQDHSLFQLRTLVVIIMTDGSHDTKRNMWLPATLLKHVASCHSSVPLAGQYSAFFEIVAMAGLSCKKKVLMPPFAFASTHPIVTMLGRENG